MSSGRVPSQSIGRYQLLRRIGRGAQAEVYLAQREGLERSFALKLLPAGISPRLAERVRREARLTSGLQHPGLVPVHEVGEHQGRLYLVMDFVTGESLQARLTRGPLPSDQAAELLAGVAEALAAAHRQGVLHRALEPDKVLIEPDGTPRLVGFSRARDVMTDSELTRTGEVLGPFHYSSLQALEGESSAAGDVYSLGVILYEALTGRLPYQGESIPLVLDARRSGPPPPPSRWAPVPASLEQVCLRCLEEDPQARFAHAGALGEALRACQAELAQAPRRGPSRRWAAAAALWVVATGAVASWGLLRRRVARSVQVAQEQLQAQARALQGQLDGLEPQLRDQAGRIDSLDERRIGLDQERSQAQARSAQARQELQACCQRLAGQPSLREPLLELVGRLEGVPGAASMQGRLLLEQDQPEQALARLEAAGDDPDARALRCMALLGLGREAEAAALRDELAKEGAGPASLWAQAHGPGISPPQRVALLQKSSQLGPRAYVLSELVRLPGIRGGPQLLEQALALDPTNTDLLFQRSAVAYNRWVTQGQRDAQLLDACMQDLFRARGLARRSMYWTYAGKTYVILGRLEAAEAELEVGWSLAKTPDEQALGLAWRGALQQEQGHPELAARSWLEAIRLAPRGRGTYEFVPRVPRLPPELRAQVEAALPPSLRRR